MFTHSPQNNEFWCCLIEKAYAKYERFNLCLCFRPNVCIAYVCQCRWLFPFLRLCFLCRWRYTVIRCCIAISFYICIGIRQYLQFNITITRPKKNGWRYSICLNSVGRTSRIIPWPSVKPQRMKWKHVVAYLFSYIIVPKYCESLRITHYAFRTYKEMVKCFTQRTLYRHKHVREKAW